MIIAVFHGGRHDGELIQLDYPIPIFSFAVISEDWVVSVKDSRSVDAEFSTEDYKRICRDENGAHHYIKT